MESTPPSTIPPQPRRGGRTAQTTERIHEAVIALLMGGGHDACTFQNVARRAEIERSTLYRRYPDRWALLAEAYAARHATDLVVAPGESFRADLLSHLRKVSKAMSSPLGTSMVAAAALSRMDPEARQSAGRYWQVRLLDIEPFVAAAIARGELDPNVDREALIGMADGPLYFRLLIVGQPIDEALIERIADDVCTLFCPGRLSETAS